MPDVAHDPVVNPSIHYVGVEGAIALQDHAQCVAQNARIMSERSDIYGDQGAYNFQLCNTHGIRFEGRGWGRDSAANGIGDYNGVNYNTGSRAMCVLVGTDDVITDVAKAGIQAFATEAVEQHGMQWPLRGHSEFVATSCPGDHLRTVVAEVNANPTGDDDVTPEQMNQLGTWMQEQRAITDKQIQNIWKWITENGDPLLRDIQTKVKK